MSLSVLFLTFAAIFVVELPDKTFIAALVLSTRYRGLLVWIGVGLAFLVQTLIAVTVGKAVTLLPTDLVHGVAKTHQQVEPALALCGVGVIDGHMVEEVVDRPAERSQRRHRAGEVFGVDGARGSRLPRFEGGDERLFLRQLCPDLA